jgi:hypothetical protein
MRRRVPLTVGFLDKRGDETERRLKIALKRGHLRVAIGRLHSQEDVISLNDDIYLEFFSCHYYLLYLDKNFTLAKRQKITVYSQTQLYGRE